MSLSASCIFTLVVTVVSLAYQSARPAQTVRDCADCPDLVVLPGGTFEMGSPDTDPAGSDRERPVRRVTVKPFAIGRYHVTRGEWAAFAKATNRPTATGCAWTARSRSKPDPEGSWQNLGFPQDDKHPVVCVTWYDAQDYVRWLDTSGVS